MKKELENKFIALRQAQSKFKNYSQKEVDKIFYKVAKTANENRIYLAKLAVEETKRGIIEDKILKNHFASEFIYNKYKNMKTVGRLSFDEAAGFEVIAAPVGIVAAITPVTNPTSTAIFKILISLKTRNGIIVSPHPAAKKCILETVNLLHAAAIEAGAPKGIIQVIETPSLQDTQDTMEAADLIIATGGGGLVRAAYSSGTPAIGVGAGNCPSIIAEDANIEIAVNSIIQSNTFDNGMVCATENSVIVDAKIYEKVKKTFQKKGGFIVSNKTDIDKVRNKMFQPGKFGLLDASLVGQSALSIADSFGIKVPSLTKMILVEVESTAKTEALAHEKLSTYVALYKSKNEDDAIQKAKDLLLMGAGHTASLHTKETNRQIINKFSTLNASRLLVNQPSALGGVGDFFNFALEPSMTLGCGSWGGNISSEQIGPSMLLNRKKVVMRRNNTEWLKVPKLYYNEGCTPEAFKDLIEDGINKILVISDTMIWSLYGDKISTYLNKANINFMVFTDIEPNPTLNSVKKGISVIEKYNPNGILAFGGGSAMDAAKLIWYLFENPTNDPDQIFQDLALTFADIRKRIVTYPSLGKKAKFIAMPTTAGTGSEVTPFAVISIDIDPNDPSKGHKKYPLADYSLMPNIAIVDAQFQMTIPGLVTAVSGMDAFTHGIESYVSILANEFSKPVSESAIVGIDKFIKRAYDSATPDVVNDKEARIGMAHASTQAGIAFGNAFLGIVHSLSHKMGGYHDVIHGQANAILLPYVIKFNSLTEYGKQALFSQFGINDTRDRYAKIALAIGLGSRQDSNEKLIDLLIDHIVELTASVGLVTSFKAVKNRDGSLLVDKEKFYASLDKMSEDAFDDQCTGANPRYPLISEIKKLYIAAFEGTDAKKLKF